MSFEEEYQTEMYWDCKQCNYKGNLGRHKTCQGGCGHELNENENFYFKGDHSYENRVTDSNLIAKAKAGPDWKCRYCKAMQSRLDKHCDNCGSDDAETSSDSEEEEVYQPLPVFPKPSKTFSFEPKKRHDTPAQPALDRDLLRKVAERSRVSYLPQKESTFPKWIFAIPGVVLLVLLLVWALTPREVDAVVSDVYFQHGIHVEKYQVTQHTGWDPPGLAFEVNKIDERIHHHDRVFDRFEKEYYWDDVKDPASCRKVKTNCRDVDCKPQKNGFAKCKRKCDEDEKCGTKKKKFERQVAKYRDVPQYRAWYRWKLWEWLHDRDIYATGHTQATHWPSDSEVALNQGLRFGERERTTKTQSYTIKFSEKDETWNYSPASLDEYKGFVMGASYHIKVQVGIVTVERKN